MAAAIAELSCANRALIATPNPVLTQQPVVRPEPFPDGGPFRLPHTFEPTSYRAHISLETTRFTGKVEITGELAEPASLIWLHGVDLVVTRAIATQALPTQQPPEPQVGAKHAETTRSQQHIVTLDASEPRADQLLGLRAATELQPGSWTLSIEYTGDIRERYPLGETQYAGYDRFAVGLFSRVVDGAHYFYTQSEHIYARTIFPCIDEPDRKVPWQLTLEVDKELVAASNTPIVRETAVGQFRKRVEFAETLPLPSYLIAFAVGPFDVVDVAPSASGVPIRILALKGRKEHVAETGRLTPQILDLLEAWLEIPYAYGKLDLVVVPRSGWGAMENPGLVTFSQRAIEGRYPALIIAHELAHQWFGNLVTLRWWDDIWLNESFAQMVASKIEAQLTPAPSVRGAIESRSAAFWYLTTGASAFRTVETANALLYGTFSPNDLTSRGAAALRLLEANAGEALFRSAIQRYVRNHAHGTVESKDVIAELTTVRHVTRAGVMGLLDGSQLPLGVELKCEKSRRIALTNVRWPLRVCVAYDRDGKRADVCQMVEPASPTIALPAKACPRWVMPNANGNGLYQIFWTKPLLDGLLDKGWAALTTVEQQTLFAETSDVGLKIGILARWMAGGGAEPLPDEERLLRDVAKYVPPALRDEFDRIVRDRFGPRARALHFKLDALSVDDPWRDLRVIELVALTRDPDLLKEAVGIARDYRKRLADPVPEDAFARAALTLTADSDPAFLDVLLADLTEPALRRDPLDNPLFLALTDVRDLATVVTKEPTKLRRILDYTPALVGRLCDAAARAHVAKAVGSGTAAARALRDADSCIAERARLEPYFRAWLAAPAKRPAPARAN